MPDTTSTFPSRPSNWTLADDDQEQVEMMDYYNVPYIGIRPIKKRLTIKELWSAFKALPVGPGGGMNVSAWIEREELKVEIEEGRI